MIGRHFVRYALVGFFSNLILYLGYLLLVRAGLDAKVAMTITYIFGVAGTFVFNRNWSFRHRGPIGNAFLRYVVVYGIGYVASYMTLAFFVDVVHFPHQWVQAVLIPSVAVLVFLLQKFWAFRPST